MKNYLLAFGFAMVALSSCQSENDLLEIESIENDNSVELTESTILVDGVETPFYTNPITSEGFIRINGELISMNTITNNDEVSIYISSGSDSFAMFSSKSDFDEVLKNSARLSELRQKMIEVSPLKEVNAKKNNTLTASSSSDSGSIILSSAHSLGGFSFVQSISRNGTLGRPIVFSNPHLRCNQFEMNCGNYNDVISSVRVVNGYAELYKGSFQNLGQGLYIDAFNGTVQINNLTSVGYNDQITSFWVSANFRASRNISGLPTELGNCSHNYSDPACNTGGGGNNGGGTGGGGGPIGGPGDQPFE